MPPRANLLIYHVPAWATDALGADSIRVNRTTAVKVGYYFEAFNRAMDEGSDKPLQAFRREYGGAIRDVRGQTFQLRFDFDELLMDWESLSDDEQDAILDEFDSP
jgi:hypothetical protein